MQYVSDVATWALLGVLVGACFRPFLDRRIDLRRLIDGDRR